MFKVRGGIANLSLRGMVKNWLLLCHGPWSLDSEMDILTEKYIVVGLVMKLQVSQRP